MVTTLHFAGADGILLIVRRTKDKPARAAPADSGDVAGVPDARPADKRDRSKRPREIGGQEGPEPTRYGDWEKNGRCTDF